MYFFKKERNKIEIIENYDGDYILIEDDNSIEKLLTIDTNDCVIASNSKQIIDKCNNLVSFLEHYREKKKVLSDALNNYNDSLKYTNNKYIEECLDFFKNINSDGKFIRGFLILLGKEIMNKEDDSIAIPLAIAFEIFQTSILIHDDIIDNASLRRGKKTIPIKYQEKYGDLTLGNNMAICAGDLGYYKSYDILIDNYSNNQRLLKYYNTIVINTIYGELVDVILPYIQKESQFKEDNLEDSIMEVYKLKTAWYSIIGPLCMGMILGNASEEKVKSIEEFAYNLGVAFQIKDDILGIYSEKVKQEKTSSDISEFKQTILYSYVYEKNKDYLSELHKYYGKNNITSTEIDCVRRIFKESKALDYATNKMTTLFANANRILDKIDFLDLKSKSILRGFIIYLENRNN